MVPGVEEPPGALGAQHVVQGVVERPQVRVDLGHEVAGQEAEPLARLDCRAGEDDAVRPAWPGGPGRPEPRPGSSCPYRPVRPRRSRCCPGWRRRSASDRSSWAGPSGPAPSAAPPRSAPPTDARRPGPCRSSGARPEDRRCGPVRGAGAARRRGGPARAASSPSMVNSLPRAWIEVPSNASSTSRRFSFSGPTRRGIRWLGTVTVTVVDTGVLVCRLPLGGAGQRGLGAPSPRRPPSVRRVRRPGHLTAPASSQGERPRCRGALAPLGCRVQRA